MAKKYLIVITALVIISTLSLLSALRHLENKSVREILGSYTFTNTKNNLFKLGKIELTNEDGEKITLYYDGIWYLEEAADYFVEENAIRTFYNIVNKSILLENVEAPQKSAEFLNIKTYDTLGNVLDDFYMAKENHELIKYAGKDNFYKAGNLNEIPFSPEKWLPYPLLSVAQEHIAAVNIDGIYASKNSLDEVKQYNENVNEFFETLKNIDYAGIIEEEFFHEEFPSANVKEIKLYLLSGLNYRLQIYNSPDGYYLKILPERELIAQTAVNGIIKQQKMYYDGWLFLLNDTQGALLYNLNIQGQENPPL